MIVANVVTDSTDNLMYEDKEGNAVFEKDIIEKNPVWSEEDERIYKVVLEILNSWSKGTIGGEIIPPNTDRYINWLKSLKERNTWKPSDEQIG